MGKTNTSPSSFTPPIRKSSRISKAPPYLNNFATKTPTKPKKKAIPSNADPLQVSSCESVSSKTVAKFSADPLQVSSCESVSSKTVAKFSADPNLIERLVELPPSPPIDLF